MLVMIFGGLFLRNTILTQMKYNWVYYLYVFGFGALLIILGLIQLYACKTENRGLITLFEIISILTFVVSLTLFIGFWVLEKQMINAITDVTNKKTTFGRMYHCIEEKKDQIFVTLCQNSTNIQTCPIADQKTIFNNNVPNRFWFDLAFFLESGARCSGITMKLDSYYFTDRTYFLRTKL